MSTLLAILVTLAACIVIGFAAFFLLLQQLKSRQEEGGKSENYQQFQQQILDIKQTLHEQLLSLSQQMNQQLSSNSRFLMEAQKGYQDTVGKVQHRLGELQQVSQSMLNIGKDISSLQDILRSPKLRGGMGELFLAELLRQILPDDHYTLQYGFRDGSKVDAVIMLGQGLIPVDAKFPLENFKRILTSTDKEEENPFRKAFIQDVKKHIDAIATKYILPDEGTFDFALMYIPAENVYYETIIKDDSSSESLSSYALRKRVIPVSPNSFYAYLQAIVRGLKGLRIERSAQIILENLGQLETDFNKCLMEFEKIGDHLHHAQSAYDRTGKRMGKLQNKLSSIEGRQNSLSDEVNVSQGKSLADNH